MKKTFEIAMGQFEFKEFNELFNIQPWFVHILIFMLIIIMNITLLNFVIAILSNTYEKLTHLSTSIYLKFIIN